MFQIPFWVIRDIAVTHTHTHPSTCEKSYLYLKANNNVNFCQGAFTKTTFYLKRFKL